MVTLQDCLKMRGNRVLWTIRTSTELIFPAPFRTFV